MMAQTRKIDSLAITASAGYGKTQSLCMRMLAILLAEPELGNINRTMALTFARAAAGEILERLLQLPTEALKNEKDFAGLQAGLQKLAGESFGSITRDELSDLLVRMCDRLSELKISTIDSLMVDLTGACALELGFFKSPEIIDPDLEKAVADDLLHELFADPDQEIINICRENMIGRDHRNFVQTSRDVLDKLVKWQELMPDDQAWGAFPTIAGTDPGTLAQALACCDADPPHEAKYREKLRPLLKRCSEMTPEQNFTREERDILNVFFVNWDKYPNYHEHVPGFKQGWDFSRCADAFRLLLSHAANIMLEQAKQRTRAANELAKRYDEKFKERVWNSGRFRFSDLSRMLHSLDGMLVDQQFRMNMQFRHFLLDEFQDTSRMQWNTMRPIIEDNGDGDHTLTLVGDVKQAIYSWRDGDSRLMGEVIRWLREHTESEREILYDLEESFRYGQSICDGLNHLFEATLPVCEKIPGNVRLHWRKSYPEHKPHKDGNSPDKPGLFAVCSVEKRAANGAAPEYLEQVAGLIARRLQEIEFRKRGLKCAILVRENDTGSELKRLLSSMPGFSPDDFVQEGDAKLISDRVNRGLTALLFYLQHPADTVSKELLLMDPVLSPLCPEGREAFARERRLLAERGVTEYLVECIRKIAARTGDRPETFAQAILTAARQYETSSPDFNASEFRTIVGNRRLGNAVQPGKVRILTVHRSKGQTFDVTFYPMGTSQSVNFTNPSRKTDILSGENWLLYGADKAALTVPALRDAVQEAGDQLIFDDLCVLYVALTRARYEAEVFLPPPGTADKRERLASAKKDKERKRIWEMKKTNYFVEDLMHDAFFLDDQPPSAEQTLTAQISDDRLSAECRMFGNREWFRNVTEKPEPSAELFSIPADRSADGAGRPVRVAPSRAEEKTQGVFGFPPRTDRGDAGTVFGTKVHEFFEKIEDLRAFTPPADTPPEILRHFDVCRKNPQIVELLSGSGGELWRERRFDLILHEDGVQKFVSGCFDRVRIRRDASGKAESAVLVDYKSNDLDESGIPEAVEHYREQMDLYARALSRLLDLKPENITGYLIFTKPGILHRMEREAHI